MEFLFVSDFDFNPNTGAAGSLISIGQHLEKLGNKVTYIWREESRVISSNNFFRFTELPFIQLRQIRNAFKNVIYDVVIISQPHAWLAMKSLKKLYPNTLFLNRSHGWELRIAPITWRLKHPQPSIVRKVKNKLTLTLLKHCSRLTVRYSDGVLCACSDDANFIKADYPFFKHKIFMNSYGLDSSFVGLDISKRKDGITNFLFAGQYLVRKGIFDLVTVFKKLKSDFKKFKLTLIINDDAVSKVKEDFAFLSDSSIQVLSWLDRNALIDLYQNSDVFLMPSYGEGFGKTTIEGMACGMCVLGYREGALTDFGVQMENALLSDTGDVNGLYENLEFALNNTNRVREMGVSAYETIQTQTWEKHAINTISIIGSLKKMNNK